jgi:PIN domain nuclease of toxin-antitoxin system
VKGILLDTHILLWWLADAPMLPGWMVERIADPDTHCYVSAASVWEIGIKRALGKLAAPLDLVPIVAEEGFRHLEITLAHAQAAAALPLLHRDPFDRMLIAQAFAESLTIATRDAVFGQYPVPLLSAAAP